MSPLRKTLINNFNNTITTNLYLQKTDHIQTSVYADGNAYHYIEQADQTSVILIQDRPPPPHTLMTRYPYAI